MKRTLFLLAMLLIFCVTVKSQENTEKKIVVFGSSVASGWVTSYQSQYDFLNGWAFRLERYLKPNGWVVLNAGVPGDNTQNALLRIKKDLIDLHPTIAIISLSLGNEGLNEKNTDSVIYNFISNLNKMINICKDAGIKPVIGYCYANNDFSPVEYHAIKKANFEIDQLNIPTINFLGAFNDGNGHFPNNHFFDNGHPDNFGHEEMFLSVPPTLFDIMQTNKPFISKMEENTYLKFIKNEKIETLNFVPDDVIHSFSVFFEVKISTGFEFVIQNTESTSILNIHDNVLEYIKNNNIVSKKDFNKKELKFALTYSHAKEETKIFVDGIEILKINEKNEPVNFILKSKNGIECRNLAIYRTCLNSDEIAYLLTGKLLNGSLEFYSPLANQTQNLALSKSELTFSKSELDKKIRIIKEKIKNLYNERTSSPKFADKIAIKLPLNELEKFTGTYFNEKLGNIIVFIKDGKLYINTMGGNISEILPECSNKFFVKSPYEITVTFNLSDKNLELNMMGRKIIVNKI